MINQHMAILKDAGWKLHKIEPELTSGYVVHQATGQIVYLEFYDGDDGSDDRTWEAVEALVAKKIRFDNYFRAIEI